MLTRDRTLLRAPADGDIELLVKLRNDVDLQHLLAARPRPNTPARVREWLAQRLSAEDALFFVIAEASTQEACGYIQLMKIDFIDGVGQLGVCVDPLARGKGYAAAALTLLEEYARDCFGLRKFVLNVLASNLRAIAFYRKQGYRELGVHQQHHYFQEQFHDVLVMERMIPRKGVV